MEEEFCVASLFCLFPSGLSPDQVVLLETVIDDVRVYRDPNECADDISSTDRTNILLFIGPGFPYLIDIFCAFQHLHYIYLSERHHYSFYSQIRGVFPTIEKLIHQLRIDIKNFEHIYPHLMRNNENRFKQEQASVLTIEGKQEDFLWKLTMLTILFESPREESINEDLIEECRYIYHDDPIELGRIDEFVKTYKSSEAIQWYTKDIFLYKLMNRALRTNNILIILKFRCIIQDIYHQLKSLYRKPSSCIQVYRGQMISTAEFQILKESIGCLIALTSFTSSSYDITTARMFAGNGEQRPNFESVIFEIFIDPSELGDGIAPFADISCFSVIPHEYEVLLSIGTVMRLENIHTNENVTTFQLRVCQYDLSSIHRFLKMVSLTMPRVTDGYMQLRLILSFVFDAIGDFERKATLARSLPKGIHPMIDFLIDTSACCSNVASIRKLGIDSSQSAKLVNFVMKGWEFMRKCSPGINSTPSLVQQTHDAPISSGLSRSEISAIFQDLTNHVSKLQTTSKQQEMFTSSVPSADSAFNLSDLPVIRAGTLFRRAKTAIKTGNIEEATTTLEGFHALPKGMIQSAVYDQQLADLYDEQGDFLTALNIYQNLLKEGVNSAALFRIHGHYRSGQLQTKLNRIEDARQSYDTVLEIIADQYHLDDPTLEPFYVRLGIAYAKLGDNDKAVELLTRATASENIETKISAYCILGDLYSRQRNYTMAYNTFLLGLEFAKTVSETPHAYHISVLHLRLLSVEKKCNDLQLRDYHIDEALKYCKGSERVQQQIMNLMAEYDS